MISKDIAVLSKLLDVSMLRHKMHANNIANINTPDYKRKHVEFESMLQKAQTDNSILKTSPKVIREESSDRIDDNSAVLEKEITGLTANSLKYQVYLKALSYKLKGLGGVIQGRFS